MRQNNETQDNDSDTLPKVYTARQVAGLLQVTPLTLYGLVRRRKLRPLAGFKRLRFSCDEIQRFISEQR